MRVDGEEPIDRNQTDRQAEEREAECGQQSAATPSSEGHAEHGPSDQCDHGAHNERRLAQIPACDIRLDLAGIGGPGIDVMAGRPVSGRRRWRRGASWRRAVATPVRPQSPSGRRSSDE